MYLCMNVQLKYIYLIQFFNINAKNIIENMYECGAQVELKETFE